MQQVTREYAEYMVSNRTLTAIGDWGWYVQLLAHGLRCTPVWARSDLAASAGLVPATLADMQRVLS